ncbi:hypothetical protein B0H14DRAFT_2659256 [Mycena olivaceomarginata]|nr:hypothetical protein B0H14DRAFT_2659256 [Mycena olivaceomarginata]
MAGFLTDPYGIRYGPNRNRIEAYEGLYGMVTVRYNNKCCDKSGEGDISRGGNDGIADRIRWRACGKLRKESDKSEGLDQRYGNVLRRTGGEWKESSSKDAAMNETRNDPGGRLPKPWEGNEASGSGAKAEFRTRKEILEERPGEGLLEPWERGQGIRMGGAKEGGVPEWRWIGVPEFRKSVACRCFRFIPVVRHCSAGGTIESAVHLGQRFVVVHPLPHHCWWVQSCNPEALANAEAPDRCREQCRGEADPPIPCWVAAFSVIGQGGVVPAQKRQRQRCLAQRDGGDTRGLAVRDSAVDRPGSPQQVRHSRMGVESSASGWEDAEQGGVAPAQKRQRQHHPARRDGGDARDIAYRDAAATSRGAWAGANSWSATSGKRVALSSGQAVTGSPDGGLAGGRILTRANGIQQVQASGTIKRVFWAYFKSYQREVIYRSPILSTDGRSELFGPIIPLVPIEGVDEAIQIIRGGPVPLVIYVFTDSEETKNRFVESTSSGTLVLNDTFTQVGVHEMPFGGSGDSGCGRLFLPKHRTYIHPNILDGSYLGNSSFNNFVNRRSFINVPPIFRALLGIPLPSVLRRGFPGAFGGGEQSRSPMFRLTGTVYVFEMCEDQKFRNGPLFEVNSRRSNADVEIKERFCARSSMQIGTYDSGELVT